MADADQLEPDSGDPFGPPAIPTLVGCLHCGQEYESYRIEWRVGPTQSGEVQGFWCCPIPGCGGMGFGFDILPVDPDYQDERGGWFSDDESEDGEPGDEEPDPPGDRGADRPPGGDPIPW